MRKDIREIRSVLGFDRLNEAQRRYYIEFAFDVLSEIQESPGEQVRLNSVEVQQDGSLKLLLAVYDYSFIDDLGGPGIHLVSYESKPVPEEVK